MSERCCQKVWSSGWPSTCSRPGSVEKNGKLYCKQHDPETVEARREKREAEWRQKSAEDSARWYEERRQRNLRERALAAIQEIAAGHNDPRALASQVLEEAGTK